MYKLIKNMTLDCQSKNKQKLYIMNKQLIKKKLKILINKSINNNKKLNFWITIYR